MTKLFGTGQLQHHFWGTYAATIAIGFADEASAKDALRVMPGFQPGKKTNWIVFHGGGEAFEAAKAAINRFRVPSTDPKARARDDEPIDSCNKSIDFGPPFAVAVEVVPVEQMSLPFG